MQRLLYISTSREEPDANTVRAVLRVSRRNNSAVGVTGLLVVGGRRFLQALEGPDSAVAEVYARIARDPRHFAAVILSRKTITQRAFGEWAMACRQVPAAGEGASLAQIVDHLVAPLDDPALRAEFLSFAALHDAA